MDIAGQNDVVQGLCVREIGQVIADAPTDSRPTGFRSGTGRHLGQIWVEAAQEWRVQIQQSQLLEHLGIAEEPPCGVGVTQPALHGISLAFAQQRSAGLVGDSSFFGCREERRRSLVLAVLSKVHQVYVDQVTPAQRSMDPMRIFH